MPGCILLPLCQHLALIQINETSSLLTSLAHFRRHSDIVAESIGWPAGSPFQLEVAFANLAIGLMGILAVSRRDGAREATVIAVTVFSLGATVVHLMDIAATGNLAPGNTLQNMINILRPALLITFLAASRRAERAPDSEAGTVLFDLWRQPRTTAAGIVTAIVATGFGIGFAIERPILGSALGIIVRAIVVYFIISRASARLEAVPSTPEQEPYPGSG